MGSPELSIGLSREASAVVSPDQAANHLGSGDLQVFATPAMAAWIEGLCRDLLQSYLQPGQTTVGAWISIEHLAPTPVGAKVNLRAWITAIEGRNITFQVEVRDQHDLIGQAEHRRVIVEVERFLRRVREKSEPTTGL
jgi:fluoroacetyl-CoA thioesterase